MRADTQHRLDARTGQIPRQTMADILTRVDQYRADRDKKSNWSPPIFDEVGVMYFAGTDGS
jgi:hypothetical protein